MTDTTLLFYDWLKCEDIFAQLYQVKCRNEWIKRQGKVFSLWSLIVFNSFLSSFLGRAKGEKQPKFEKCSTGVILFVVLLFVIWFPLIILSSGLPGSSPNPVLNVDMSIGVVGWDPLYHINQDFNGSLVSSSTFSILRKNPFITSDDSTNTQILTMPKVC